MANVDGDPIFTAPDDLVHEGLEWARGQAIEARRGDAEEALKALFVNGSMLHAALVDDLADRVRAGGGVRHISERSFLGSGHNMVNLNNGYIPTSHLFSLEPFENPLTTHHVAGSDVEQTHVVQVSFGIREAGVAGYEPHRVGDKALSGANAQRQILNGEMQPSSICIIEGITTRYGDDDVSVFTARALELNTQQWSAKLRPGIAPNPLDDPDGYAAWLNSDGVPMMNVSFSSSPIVQERFWHGYDRYGLDRPRLDPIINQSGDAKLDLEGVESMLRFEEMLAHFYRQRFGSTMPVPWRNEDAPVQAVAETSSR